MSLTSQKSDWQVWKQYTDGLSLDEREGLTRRKLRRPRTSPLNLQIHIDERRRSKKLAQMQITRMFQLSKLETADEAVAKLLEFAEKPYRFISNMK